MQPVSEELEQLIGRVVGGMGAAANAALVMVGDRLGLYRALASGGPATPGQLAERTGTHERYVREWLAAQAASGYIDYAPERGLFSMTPEQAMLFAEEDSSVFMAGGFYSTAALFHGEQKLADVFRSGEGISWGDQHECLFCGTEKFFRPAYASNLVQSWIPALADVEPKLDAGATVADIGCGHGCSTLIMARAYPNSQFFGFDFHAPSVEHARQLADEEGLTNVRFEVGSAQDFPAIDAKRFDFVTIFDALHDMGDPVGAARRVRQVLKQDGTWMIVEPAAADRLEENLNPIGRVCYAFSTAVCVPSAMSQNGGHALGAQAGPETLKRVLADGGFSDVRVATRTPFNLVLDARI